MKNERNLIRRINTRLAPSDEQLHKSRADSQWLNELGDFYITNVRHNFVVDSHVDLDALACELGIKEA